MNLRTGTNHFQTRKQAVRYYARQGYTENGVDVMLEDGTISLGAPTIKRGQSWTTDADGRYWIMEKRK